MTEVLGLGLEVSADYLLGIVDEDDEAGAGMRHGRRVGLRSVPTTMGEEGVMGYDALGKV